MNLSHLNYFVTLADEQHFANTAKSLFIARSTLSLAISQLERELGAPLFTKNGSTFLLTPYGEEFYRYASLALQNIETGKKNVLSMLDGEVETLRIGVPFAMQDENWARVLRGFRNTSEPPVPINIHQGFSEGLLREIAVGNLDFAFAAKMPDAPDHLTYAFPYWAQQMVVVVNKDNPLAKRKKLSFEDLRGVHMHSYAEGSPVHAEMKEYVDRFDLDIEESFKDEITICSTIAADETMVALVDYSFLIKVFPDVVCIPIEEMPADFHKLYLVHREGEPLSGTAARFMEYMKDHPVPQAHLNA